MIYPTLLLMTAILIVIGLGLYQRLKHRSRGMTKTGPTAS